VKKSSFNIIVFSLAASLAIGFSLIGIFSYYIFAPSILEGVKMGVLRVQVGDSLQDLSSQMEQNLHDLNSAKWKIYVDPTIASRKSAEMFVGGGNAIFLQRVARAYECKLTVSSKNMCFYFIK